MIHSSHEGQTFYHYLQQKDIKQVGIIQSKEFYHDAVSDQTSSMLCGMVSIPIKSNHANLLI